MKLSELFEERQEVGVNRVIAILPGRFQPPTPAHIAAYRQLVAKFGADNVFITMTSAFDLEKSPFTYDERKQIFVKMLGVPANKILNVKNQYNTEQIVKLLRLQDDTAIVFAVGQKDMEANPRFTVKSADSYVQKYKPGDESSYLYHMFIDVIDTKKFSINNVTMKSATEIRKIFRTGTDKEKRQAFVKLYGKIDEHIFHMMVQKLTY